MKNIILTLKVFLKDRDMYFGIFTEVAFVIALSMIGFLICLALQG